MSKFEFDCEGLSGLIGCEVVLDLKSPYVCLGTLRGLSGAFLELDDADLHDLRDTKTSREVYVYDSRRFGIRRNRSKALVRLDEVVAITKLSDILET